MEQKKCNKCKKHVPFEGMKKSSRSKSGYESICKECVKKASKKYRAENKEKVSAYNKKYNAENKEANSAHHKAVRQANPELAKAKDKAHREKSKDLIKGHQAKYRADNKEKEILRHAKYSRENKGMANNNSALRRARLKQVAIPVVNEEQYTFFMQEIYKHAIDKSNLTGIPCEVDHLVPLTNERVTGLHNPANLQVITRAANRSKGSSFTI